MRRMPLALAIFLLTGCASQVATRRAPSLPMSGKAPYDAAPAANNAAIDIAIDAGAAREILESLARSRLEPSDLKLLEDLVAVRLAIQDSTRTPDVFERDFAAAFQSETRAAVFDFHSVREGRDRWQALLHAIMARDRDLIGLSQRRAVSLLPGDRPVSVKLQVFFSLGLAGLEDHLVVRSAAGSDVMVIDFARALGDAESATIEEQLSRLSRLIAGEAFQQAWNEYRESAPSWKVADTHLGQLEPFMKLVAAGGPVGLFTVDENFFPLSVWLKEPMRRALDDLNHRAERFVQAQENLEQRMELAAELRRPDFARRAASIGAFLADVIAQDAGAAGLRTALGAGPRAFFEAYDRAAQKDKNLIPLAKPIRDKLK